jgi:long-chain acyl-CoA synthetase
MSSLILFTSGSTKEPKEINHNWQYIYQCAKRSIRECNMTKDDVVLDIFPPNVIAHYTITALPAQLSGAKLITSNFDPYAYTKLFNKYRPTIIALIPNHVNVLNGTKEWHNTDLSCVRYMIMGSQNVPQEMIDDLRKRGVKTVANWYGSTENPPPVFVAHNNGIFDFIPREGYNIRFTEEGECVINDFHTGDIFDVENHTFLKRKTQANGTTWKTISGTT